MLTTVQLQNSAEGILVNGSPDLKTVMREINLKQANYFHKGFLTNVNLHNRIPIVTCFCIFLSKCNYRNKQVKPLMLMASTKSTHLLPDNSLKAFDGFYCTWKPVKFQWKHFTVSAKIDMKQYKNTCFSNCSGFFETNLEVAFFFWNSRKFF